MPSAPVSAMAILGPGEPQDPRVRTALDALRVVAVVVLLALIVVLVIDRRNGGFEYLMALLAFVAGLLGMPWLSKMMRRE